MTLAETDITSELILRAFEVTGLRPVDGVSYSRDGDESGPSPCGCALGALALAFEVLNPMVERVITDEVCNYLGVPNGRGWVLAVAFDAGFAGMEFRQDEDEDPLYLAGYDAGRILRERAAVAR